MISCKWVLDRLWIFRTISSPLTPVSHKWYFEWIDNYKNRKDASKWVDKTFFFKLTLKDIHCWTTVYLEHFRISELFPICQFTHNPLNYHSFLVTSALRGFPAKRDSRLANNDDKVLSGKTAEQCADACEKENSFPCRSFDYDRNGTTCYLSKVASGEAGLTSVNGFDYYEMSELLFYLPLSKHIWILNIIMFRF